MIVYPVMLWMIVFCGYLPGATERKLNQSSVKGA